MTRSPALFLATALLAAALCGCGTSPPTRFITLGVVESQGRHTRLSGTPVGVGHVTLPVALQRQALVVRQGDNRLEVFGTVRWAGPFSVMIRRTLAQNLAARLPQGMVILPGHPNPERPMRLFIVTFQTFSASASGVVTLKAHWTLVEADSGDELFTRETRITIDANANHAGEIAQAMSRALARLAERMVSALINKAPSTGDGG